MGANRHRGEVEFQVELSGKKKTYRFRLGCNELIRLQDDMGMAGEDAKFLNTLDRPSGLKQMRQIMRGGLLQFQPEITDEEVGEIVTAYGRERMFDVYNEAIRWMLPEPAKEATGKDDGPALSAGPDSSPTPLEPASDQISATD